MEDFMDVFWSPRDILEGERLDRGHNLENICIGVFHVSGHLDNFGRHLFFGKKNEFGGMGRPPPWEVPPKLFYFI